MKTLSTAKLVKILLPVTVLALGACSTLRGEKTGQDLASSGPTVLNPRANPSVIELNSNFQPKQPAEVLADVKDFTSPITDVKLRFNHAPLEVPMEHVQGSTWRAMLSPEQVKTLAVGGQTTRYDANVIARNQDGQTASSKNPVEIVVKAPDLAQNTG
jgi:hypothetical protein